MTVLGGVQGKSWKTKRLMTIIMTHSSAAPSCQLLCRALDVYHLTLKITQLDKDTKAQGSQGIHAKLWTHTLGVQRLHPKLRALLLSGGVGGLGFSQWRNSAAQWWHQDSLPGHTLPYPGYVRMWLWWSALSTASPRLPESFPTWDGKMGLVRWCGRDEAGRLEETKAAMKVKNW